MRSAVVLIGLVACKGEPGRREAPPPPKVADAAIDAAPAWTARCAEVLAGKLTPVRKLGAIVDGCRPCGDWTVLLDWNTQVTEGGPREQAILDAMDACDAYCSKTAKMQFAGALPDARGKSTNKPWRVLGAECGEAVSAKPDERFMSAPYFALDRIARAAAADPVLAPLAAAVELPLPAYSMTGVGYELPAAAVMKPEPGKFHVTVTAGELRIGVLPTARLGANGVTVDLGAVPYPGELVTAKDLRARLDALTGSPTARVVVIAPASLPASRVADVVAAAGTHEVVLAVAATGAPKGWTLPGIVPVLLDAAPAADQPEWKLDDGVDQAIAELARKPAAAAGAPRIAIAKAATVAQLAKLLGALAFRDARAASLTKQR